MLVPVLAETHHITVYMIDSPIIAGFLAIVGALIIAKVVIFMVKSIPFL